MPTLEFKGKQHIYAHHLTVPHRPLVPDADKSHGDTEPPDDNLIIHGDNLHALKALLPRYAGRVDCVYIDPPFNTGSQAWVYNDNVNSPLMRKWLRETAPVDGDDLERHDKWLCMMWPRLQLLNELLSEDGVIYVSIDDHEQHHLRALMDEIFGEKHFVACIASVVNLKGSRDNRGFTNSHEYILMYSKGSANLRELPLEDDDLDDWIEDDRGWYKRGANLRYSGENAPRHRRPNLYFPLFVAADGTVDVVRHDATDTELYPITENGDEVTWRWSKERIAENRDEIIAVRNASGWTLHKKQRPVLGLAPTRKPKSTLYDPRYSATTATTEVKSIFDGRRVFDYPKSRHLIMDLLRIAAIGDGGIVLDSFAGSGTTAHAVLALNREDGGKRKFILVECEDYADSITAERVRRVITGKPSPTDTTLRGGVGESFTYCTLGDPIDVETMLSGEKLPEFNQLAAHLLYTATGVSAPESIMQVADDEPFYCENGTDYYLRYRPDIDWLRGNEATLGLDFADRIAERGREAVVFAAGKHMGQRDLTHRRITFCQVPFEIYRSR